MSNNKEDNNRPTGIMQPYEKFSRFGAKSLSDEELLAIIIRTGTNDKSSVDIGREVLNLSTTKAKGLIGIHHLEVQDLMSIKGIGYVKATKIKCVTEFSRRISMQTMVSKVRFNRPELVAEYYMEELRHEESECVIAVYTDAKNSLIRDVVISKGTINRSLLSPRDVFSQALKCQAANILLVHNHPSGDPTPSNSDIQITDNILKLSKLMGIDLIDHIIIGDNHYISFKEQKLL